MELKLKELTHKSEVCKIYEIYKHCMFMATEEKFNKKMDAFLMDDSVKIFACFNKSKMVGAIVVSFKEQRKIEILGIAVDQFTRGRGVGSYMINQLLNDYGLISVYAETDDDAVAFYHKNGFCITEFSEIYGAEPVIRYQCELDRSSNMSMEP